MDLSNVHSSVIYCIMAYGFKKPQDVMNFGLTCRAWYKIAKEILLNTPQALAVTSLPQAYRLGWPCVIEFHSTKEALDSFPGIELYGACLRKKREELNYLCNADARSVFALATATHPRLGADSPASMICQWTLRKISEYTLF